jgi:hypothetical protein
MKNQTFLCLLFAFMLLAGLQCPKDSNNPPTPAEPEPSLPPITTQGLNTVGCKIDGKVWVPYSKTSVPCLYSGVSRSANWKFEFNAQEIKNASQSTNYIEMYFGSLIKDTIFNFTNNRTGNIFYFIPNHSTGTEKFNTDETLKNGKVHILLFDSINQIISGTFYCTVIDSNTKIKHEITDGRFDLRFNY